MIFKHIISLVLVMKLVTILVHGIIENNIKNGRVMDMDILLRFRIAHISYTHIIFLLKSDYEYGYRTIMGYYAAGHEYRVNIYSNPNIHYGGYPTGIVDLSNNARFIAANR